MAPPVSQSTSLPFAGCGTVASPRSGRDDLAAETAIIAAGAQSTMTSMVYILEASELQSQETPHNVFQPALVDATNLRAAPSDVTFGVAAASSLDDSSLPAPQPNRANALQAVSAGASLSLLRRGWNLASLDCLPNEILMHILGFLDVNDILTTSRINHHFRNLSLTPILHTYRLQRVRDLLPPLLTSPSRPTLAELTARHIFLTHTTQISRRLAWNLVAIRLSRRLPQRPSAETLVQRGVLPPECVPGCGCAPVAPALVAKRRAVERERLKDGLRRWVGGVWRGEVKERSEGVKKWEEHAGVGRVWRLRRFWERVGQGNI